MMTVQGSPVVRYLTAAAAIVVFGLRYASDLLAPISLPRPSLSSLPLCCGGSKREGIAWLALLVMVLALGGVTNMMLSMQL